jgi:putative phosphoesterase
MRVAILSDIHGNSIALDAVLDDIQRAGGADAFWILGDLAAMGPDPIGVLGTLNELPNALFVRGNTDRYVCGLLDPKDTADAIKQTPDRSLSIVTRQAMLSWVQGALTSSGWINWLATLELEQRANLPDNTRVLLVHAAPGTDDGHGIHPKLTADELAEHAAGCDADIVFVGHTHWQHEAQAGRTRLINLGSVGLPWAGRLQASYYLLDADSTSHRLEHRQVDYDRLAVIEQLQRQNHPGVEYLSARYRGEIASAFAA